MRQQMFFAGGIVNSTHFSRINVQPVLTLLRETDVEGNYILRNVVRHKFRQSLLLHSIFMQRRHEIG